MNTTALRPFASFCIFAALSAATARDALAYQNAIDRAKSFMQEVESQSAPTFVIPAAGQLEVAFSPAEGGQALVLKVIDSAKTEIRMLAYSLTSVSVVKALIAAQKRGVTVKVVADEKHNLEQDRTGKGRSALAALVNSGVDVRVISKYFIHHDKCILVDRKTVQTGSFNYSTSAEKYNSENVLVNWNNPDLARVFIHHFERNYALSKPHHLRY